MKFLESSVFKKETVSRTRVLSLQWRVSAAAWRSQRPHKCAIHLLFVCLLWLNARTWPSTFRTFLLWASSFVLNHISIRGFTLLAWRVVTAFVCFAPKLVGATAASSRQTDKRSNKQIVYFKAWRGIVCKLC